MFGLFTQNPVEFIIIAILLLLAISVHEFSHALIADHLGDPTARLSGRLTLNPAAHIDPIGTLLLLFVGFGWGKPVPFDPFNLREPKRDAALISFAGPGSNLVMAILTSIILRVAIYIPFVFLLPLVTDVLSLFVYFNVLLAIFNLIPVHPLDGFKVVAGLLPKKYYYDWLSLEKYGIIFLILLIFPFFGSSPVIALISPIINFLVSLLLPASHLGGII
ncbi:site-2 protease family protein [Patescibacteria group bacterium]|nr:site-2 protease family protein [Patescibacteria group bacterium]MCL5797581.1 site-2 protease family protein [Patescibacteria group bacterium]